MRALVLFILYLFMYRSLQQLIDKNRLNRSQNFKIKGLVDICYNNYFFQFWTLQQNLSNAFRGGTRLDGAWGKKQVRCPPCSNLRSFRSKRTVLKKVLVTLLGLFYAPAVIRCPRSYSAPAELRVPCPPIVTPLNTSSVPTSFAKGLLSDTLVSLSMRQSKDWWYLLICCCCWCFA